MQNIVQNRKKVPNDFSWIWYWITFILLMLEPSWKKLATSCNFVYRLRSSSPTTLRYWGVEAYTSKPILGKARDDSKLNGRNTLSDHFLGLASLSDIPNMLGLRTSALWIPANWFLQKHWIMAKKSQRNHCRTKISRSISSPILRNFRFHENHQVIISNPVVIVFSSNWFYKESYVIFRQ